MPLRFEQKPLVYELSGIHDEPNQLEFVDKKISCEI